MKIKLVLLALCILSFSKIEGEEMLLAQIGLKFAIPTNHWGGGIVRDDPNNFEAIIMQDGKGKMFFIGTYKSDTESFDADASEVEKSLVASNCKNLRKEFIVFLGHKCCKINGDFPAETYIAKRNVLFYIFYARGLRYEMNASVGGINPPVPEEDSDIQEILKTMTFTANSNTATPH